MPRLHSEAELEADDPWLQRCRAQDQAAWGEFFNRYHSFVRRTARRLGALEAELDDVEQEVFTVAFRHIAQFERGRMTTWLFRLTSNVMANRQRSRRVRESVLGWLGLQPQAPSRTPEHEWERTEAQTLVRSLVARLSPKKRDVFALFELEGLRGEEIAELLEVNLATVWTRLHHARKDFEALARRAGVTP